MIFVLYLPPGPGGKGGNVTKEFKLVLESVKYLIVEFLYDNMQYNFTT